MCIGQAEPLNEGHLCVISTHRVAWMTKETSESQIREDECETQDFTGDHAPINQRAYRVSPTERRIIHEEVQKMLDEVVAEKWRGVFGVLKQVEEFNSLKSISSDPVLGMYDERASMKSILMQAGTVSELSSTNSE
ncbi:hypothetical protein TNCV_2296381 [Trichonephila clavipes]|nr:hypothetical protein TNCV_2296381 [Trichonephila clavipes]